MEPSEEVRLSGVLMSLAVALLNDRTLKADLERLSRVACRLIEHCSGGSVSMLVEGEPSTVAVTDRVALELDVVQYAAGDGPCVAALGGEVIRIGYLAADERFPPSRTAPPTGRCKACCRHRRSTMGRSSVR